MKGSVRLYTFVFTVLLIFLWMPLWGNLSMYFWYALAFLVLLILVCFTLRQIDRAGVISKALLRAGLIHLLTMVGFVLFVVMVMSGKGC